MTPSRYLVIRGGDAWAIRGANRTLGPFSDRVHAIDAAIDYAEKDGKAGRSESLAERGRDVANRLDLWARLVP
jgi:hypothetical protein